MLKQSMIYLFLSILIVILKKYVKLFLIYIDMFFAYLSLKIAPILTAVGIGNPMQKILSLLLAPMIITALPALLYYLFKRKTMPHYFTCIWCIWWVIVLSNLLIR